MAEIRVERAPKRGLGWLWALLLLLLVAAIAWYVWNNHVGAQPGTATPDTTRVGAESERIIMPLAREARASRPSLAA